MTVNVPLEPTFIRNVSLLVLKDECRVFNKTWTEVRGKAVCLFVESKLLFKDYSLNRNYDTKHTEKYKNLLMHSRDGHLTFSQQSCKSNKDFLNQAHPGSEDQLCDFPQKSQKHKLSSF